MKKLKYQGGITKLIASKIAKKNKEGFVSLIDSNIDILLNKVIQDKKIFLEVVSFSSYNDFYEQVLSILSFVRYIGNPISWTLFSDGSHTVQQMKLLTNTFEFIKIEQMDWSQLNSLPKNSKKELLAFDEQFIHYAKALPLGRRLFYYLDKKIKNPTLFIDSDILFYEKASVLNLVLSEKVNGWYMPDAFWGCLDSRYMEKHPEQMYQVNGGFFLFNKDLSDLSEGLEFLKSLDFKYEYFSDQNIFHILMKDNGFIPFDPRIFILNSGDQFDFSYLYSPKDMAIRHYTGPVRHKMWQKDYKWHLSIK